MVNHVQVIIEEFPRRWKWLLILGIFDVVIGAFGLIFAGWVTISTVILFGILMFLAGVLQFIHWFGEKETSWSGRIPHLVFALLYVIGGVLIFLNPVQGASAFTILLGALFITIGTFRLGLAIFLARHGWRWFWHALLGLITVYLGFYIIVHWPLSSIWVIGLLVSIELVLNGWQLIWVSLMARKLGKELEKVIE